MGKILWLWKFRRSGNLFAQVNQATRSLLFRGFGGNISSVANSQLLNMELPLPADEGWPNIRGYGSSACQTARPSTLLLYARHCGRFGRLAKRLKAYKSIFPKGLQSTQTAGLSLATV